MPIGDTVLHNATLWQCEGDSLVVREGRIAATGNWAELATQNGSTGEAIDLAGRLVTPGLIDCHTHLVHGGSRADEFALRLCGASYEEIARRGGGIMSTVRATRRASFEELLQTALQRVDALQRDGVTTVEIKSGYGLDLETERKMLRVARAIPEHRAVSVQTTYLGAHARPPEFETTDAYLDFVCETALPTLHHEGLVDAVDGFCENIAFSPAQMERVFRTAVALGLPVKLHAEQLSDQGGAGLAARFGALSADHLEWLSEAGIAAMAGAGTIAVMLPGAFFSMRETRKPPVAALRAAGVPMAVATDLNPGTSPITSLLTAMNQAAILFGLTTDEVIDGVTRHAAAALGLGDRGVIAPGHTADLVIWDTSDPADLLFGSSGRKVWRTMVKGKWIV